MDWFLHASGFAHKAKALLEQKPTAPAPTTPWKKERQAAKQQETPDVKLPLCGSRWRVNSEEVGWLRLGVEESHGPCPLKRHTAAVTVSPWDVTSQAAPTWLVRATGARARG